MNSRKNDRSQESPLGWQDARTRRDQLDETVCGRGTARFGSEEMDEADKAERVRRHFASVARRYDLLNTILSMGIQYYWKWRGMRHLAPAPGERILDVCGGTGDLSVAALRRVGASGRVICFDINRDMLEAGRETGFFRSGRRRIQWVQGNAEAICFGDQTVDAVTIGFAVRNITHMKRAFSEMHRVLKPGGRLMCLEFSRPVTPWFRRLYDIYSFHIMPRIGALLAGDRTAYLRLPETIRLFLLPDEFSRVLEETGFRRVRHEIMTDGIAVCHTAVK